MTFVDVVVKVDTAAHSFVSNPSEARAIVENILRRDPRFSTCRMTVTTEETWIKMDDPEDVVDEEYSSERVTNIFEKFKDV